MKKILIISYRFPYPLTDGSKIRIYNVSKILAQKYQVDLLAINEGPVADEHIKGLERIFNKVIVYPFRPIRFKLNTLKGLLSKDSLQIYYHHFGEVQKWVDENYTNYDMIFCFHIRMTRYLRKVIDKPKAIDFIDATSINYQEAQEVAKGLWRFIYPVENRRLLAYELKMLKIFDRVFITSHYDKTHLEHYVGRPLDHLIALPNGVRDDLFVRPSADEEQNWIVFLGRMGYAPNVDAVTYFAREVFPLIREKEEVKFLIVGADPTNEVLGLQSIQGVKVTGFVEDPYEYLERAKVVVAPLRFSAGIQNKILEAMALRKAVVTTSKGARGIAGKCGEHFLIADTPKDMAEKILMLLHNPALRKRIGENGRRLIETNYRWDIVSEKLLTEIDKVLHN